MNRDHLLGLLQVMDLIAFGIGAFVLVLCLAGRGNGIACAFAILTMALGAIGIVLVEIARYAR